MHPESAIATGSLGVADCNCCDAIVTDGMAERSSGSVAGKKGRGSAEKVDTLTMRVGHKEYAAGIRGIWEKRSPIKQ